MPETVITVGPTGDRLDRAIAEFRQLADAGESLLFKVWTSGDDEMLCEFKHERSTRVEMYWFGQLETDDVDFVSALLERFKREAGRGEAAIVVDWHAISENFDWVEFLNGQAVYSGTPPEILGLPSQFSSMTRLELDGFQTEWIADHVLYTRVELPV